MMKPNTHERLTFFIGDRTKTDGQGEPTTTAFNMEDRHEYDGNLVIGENDVLCGRGGLTNSHIGNIRYRLIVADHQAEYLRARKPEKVLIANRVVALIKDNGGRFLRKSGEDWFPISDKKAQEKTSQALREGLDVRNKTIRPNKQIRRDLESDPAGGHKRTVPHVATGKVLSSPIVPVLKEEPGLDMPALPPLPPQRQISQSEIGNACGV